MKPVIITNEDQDPTEVGMLSRGACRGLLSAQALPYESFQYSVVYTSADTTPLNPHNTSDFTDETVFPSVMQAGVHWPDDSSLQPQTPGLKQSSYFSVLSSWHCRHIS
ncbi:hypothetical protein AAY473_000077 [Plecturocebus cupreus]